jgi:MSHA biogenesis protein MshI
LCPRRVWRQNPALFGPLAQAGSRHHCHERPPEAVAVLSLRKRKSFSPGWVAMAPQGDSVRVAHVVQAEGERPALRWVCEAPWGDPAQALRGLRRSRALQRQRTVAVLPWAHYQLLPMDAPEVPREEWRDALRWRLKDMVEFPIDNAGIELLEVPGGPAQRRAPALIAVAAPHTSLAPLADAGNDAGLPWHAIDVPETALRNLAALAALVDNPDRGQALLHVGAQHSTLVVTWQGELMLARHIDVTYTQLTDSDEAMRQQSFERASLELQRTLDSVERQFSQANLARLLVAPGAPLAEFIRYVGDLVYVPVAAFELGALIDLSAVPELSDAVEQAAYLPAIGAALRHPD